MERGRLNLSGAAAQGDNNLHAGGGNQLIRGQTPINFARKIWPLWKTTRAKLIGVCPRIGPLSANFSSRTRLSSADQFAIFAGRPN
jgi:hypothetical protein